MAQDKGGADCEVCFGDADTCGCREEDGRSLCEMSDSACSLQDGECASASTHETWLVQEYCGLGTLQVAVLSACPEQLHPWLPLIGAIGKCHVCI
jgi:hypothetical protein